MNNGEKPPTQFLPRQMGHFRSRTPSLFKNEISLCKGSVGHLSREASQLVWTRDLRYYAKLELGNQTHEGQKSSQMRDGSQLQIGNFV